MTTRHLEQRLRAELQDLARVPVPSVAGRVMARLPDRPRQPRRFAALYVAAAALAIVAALFRTAARDPWPPPGSDANVAAAAAPQLLPRLALGAPVAPEAALRDEGRRLAQDTRRAAVSLWDALPMSTLLARELPRVLTGRSAD